jgi:hypothetical protein
MAVYVNNLIIDSGTTFNQIFTLEDAYTNSALNLTNHTVSSQMRKHSGSSNSVSFASTIVRPAYGEVSVGLSTSQTILLKPGRYVYDVLITSPEKQVTKVVEGMVLVREGVTR